MLICVYLMNDKEKIECRLSEVLQLQEELRGQEFKSSRVQGFEGNVQCSSELDCYLTTALFIVTHNPVLRKQVKAWCQSHPDCPLAIRRFLSIAKKIRC